MAGSLKNVTKPYSLLCTRRQQSRMCVCVCVFSKWPVSLYCPSVSRAARTTLSQQEVRAPSHEVICSFEHVCRQRTRSRLTAANFRLSSRAPQFKRDAKWTIGEQIFVSDTHTQLDECINSLLYFTTRFSECRLIFIGIVQIVSESFDRRLG